MRVSWYRCIEWIVHDWQVTYTIYMARRIPIPALRRIVRANFEAMPYNIANFEAVPYNIANFEAVPYNIPNPNPNPSQRWGCAIQWTIRANFEAVP